MLSASRTIFARAALATALLLTGFTLSPPPSYGDEIAPTAPKLYHATEQPQLTALAKKTFTEMQSGHLDVTRFAAPARKALDAEALGAAATQLQELGIPTWSFVGEYHVATSATPAVYALHFPAVDLRLEIATDAAGKITTFFLSPAPES